MHEHVGDQLIWLKIAGHKEMKPKIIGQVDMEPIHGKGGQIKQNIDYQ